MRNIPDPPMLIDRLITEASITMVAGKTYSGKTFVGLEAALCVAFGKRFMGQFEAGKPGNVLFLEGDSPRFDTGRALYSMATPTLEAFYHDPEFDPTRLDALQVDWNVTGANLDLANPMDLHAIANAANSMVSPIGTHQEAAGDLVYQKGCKLIVIDTFKRYHLKDEDKSVEMQPIMNALDNLRSLTGAAIIFLHHTTKSDRTKARGSTVIEGSVDNWFTITKTSKRHKLEIEKSRGKEVEPFWFTIGMVGGVKTVAFDGYAENTEKPQKVNLALNINNLAAAGGSGVFREDFILWIQTHGDKGVSFKTALKWGLKYGKARQTIRNWTESDPITRNQKGTLLVSYPD